MLTYEGECLIVKWQVLELGCLWRWLVWYVLDGLTTYFWLCSYRMRRSMSLNCLSWILPTIALLCMSFRGWVVNLYKYYHLRMNLLMQILCCSYVLIKMLPCIIGIQCLFWTNLILIFNWQCNKYESYFLSSNMLWWRLCEGEGY